MLRVVDLEVVSDHKSVGDVAVECVDRVAYLAYLVAAEVRSVAAEAGDLVLDVGKIGR